jgi:hypothetical protein
MKNRSFQCARNRVERLIGKPLGEIEPEIRELHPILENSHEN